MDVVKDFIAVLCISANIYSCNLYVHFILENIVLILSFIIVLVIENNLADYGTVRETLVVCFICICVLLRFIRLHMPRNIYIVPGLHVAFNPVI